MFNVDSSERLKSLTITRLGMSHLVDHKSRHKSQDCVNPVCSCGQGKLTVVQDKSSLKK